MKSIDSPNKSRKPVQSMTITSKVSKLRSNAAPGAPPHEKKNGTSMFINTYFINITLENASVSNVSSVGFPEMGRSPET
jgi:hypothetical protein